MYRARLLAAAVEAMSKSASRERLDCPAARAAANIRPYMRAPSASNCNGSHVALAHCSRSWRRARSSLSSVACGPAASSARVIAEIADSSGSNAGSIRSWSITTDVSRSPLVGSAIDSLIYHSIEICTEPFRVDPRCAGCSFGKGFSGHEPARPYGPQLGDWRAVAGYNDCSTRFHLAKHGRGLIAKLALRDDSVHRVSVAHVALCSSPPSGPIASAPAVTRRYRKLGKPMRSYEIKFHLSGLLKQRGRGPTRSWMKRKLSRAKSRPESILMALTFAAPRRKSG